MIRLPLRLLLFLVLVSSQTAYAQEANVEEVESKNEVSVIPFRLTKWNNIIVPAKINDEVSVDLMFHTAVDSASIIKATADKHPSLKFDQSVNIHSWGGKSESKVSTGNRLQIGDHIENDVMLFQGLHSGHESDGKFGPPQLGSKFFEIDFTREQLVLYSELPSKVESWIELDLSIEDGMMFLGCELTNGDGDSAEHSLMIHSGYSGGVLLDDSFAASHEWVGKLKVLEESRLTDSMGNVLKTKKSTLPGLGLGPINFPDVSVSFFSGAIQRQKFSLLGGAILKEMNWVFDIAKNRVYLLPIESKAPQAS